MAANINDKLKSTWNNEAPAPTTVTAARNSGTTTLALQSVNWPTDTAIDFATYSKNPDGSPNQASVQEFTGIVSGNNITSLVKTSGGADSGNSIGDVAVMKPTAKGNQDLVDAMKASHNQDGSLKDGIVTTAKIANGAVTSDTLAQSAVKAENIDFASLGNRTQSFNTVGTTTINLTGLPSGTYLVLATCRATAIPPGADSFIRILLGGSTQGQSYMNMNSSVINQGFFAVHAVLSLTSSSSLQIVTGLMGSVPEGRCTLVRIG